MNLYPVFSKIIVAASSKREAYAVAKDKLCLADPEAVICGVNEQIMIPETVVMEGTVTDYSVGHPEMDVTYRFMGKIPENTGDELALKQQLKEIAIHEGGMTSFKVQRIVAVVVE